MKQEFFTLIFAWMADTFKSYNSTTIWLNSVSNQPDSGKFYNQSCVGNTIILKILSLKAFSVQTTPHVFLAVLKMFY